MTTTDTTAPTMTPDEARAKALPRILDAAANRRIYEAVVLYSHAHEVKSLAVAAHEVVKRAMTYTTEDWDHDATEALCGRGTALGLLARQWLDAADLTVEEGEDFIDAVADPDEVLAFHYDGFYDFVKEREAEETGFASAAEYGAWAAEEERKALKLGGSTMTDPAPEVAE